jgi:hypothetical protein
MELSTLLHAILPPTFLLLNVFLQIANKNGFFIKKKKKKNNVVLWTVWRHIPGEGLKIQ